MFSARPGSSRLFIGPKKASEQASASPPLLDRREIDAALDGRARASRRSSAGADQSAATRPKTRKRATPPSGKMFSRTCVTGAPGAAANRFCASGRTGICGSSSVHSHGLQRRQRRAARRVDALDRHERRAVADEEVRVDVEADDRARRAQLQHAPVVAGAALAAALPAVHPLAAVGELALDEDAAPGLDQVVGAGEEVVAGAEHLAAESEGGEIDQAGERGSSRGGLAHAASRCSRARPIGPAGCPSPS